MSLPNDTTVYKVGCKKAVGLCSQVLKQEAGMGEMGSDETLRPRE